MQGNITLVLTVIVGVAGVVATLVGPLYYLVLSMRRSDGNAEAERENLAGKQDDLSTEMGELEGSIQDLRQDLNDDMGELKEQVSRNAIRSEQNQRHIHQLLVGRESERDEDIGNPHHTAENCPLPDECPFHSDGA